MNNKLPAIQRLPFSADVAAVINQLPHSGKITILAGGFSYLDIDDRFIHAIYPLLNYPGIVKRDYFSDENSHMGAHISITYPEENVQLDSREENKQMTFTVEGLFTADLLNKRYFALKVNAPDLIHLRRQYGLGDNLQLKGYLLEPHITVGTLEL
jgi:hypothetical protein